MLRVRTAGTFAVCAGIAVLSLVTLSCTESKPAAPPPQKMWGDMKPIVSVKELMHDMIDPIADNIFESVKIIVDAKGTHETKPTTEEDWDRIRVGAVTLAEGAYLLKVPRPFAPPGDLNNSVGPDASELSPDQITAKLERDPVLWNAKIEALRNVGLETLEIIKQKDAQRLWDAGEDLDDACESCHIQYWYPGDRELLRKLDQKLEELYGPRANRTPIGMTPGEEKKSGEGRK